MTDVCRRSRLKAARLYVVLDRDVRNGEALLTVLKKTVSAGAGIVQWRDKNGSARDIIDLCERAIRQVRNRVPFIVNDRVDIALAVRADGVHLGQEDLPVKHARTLVGKQMLIGQSCQTVEQALRAQAEGADYIGFGSAFRTKTKLGRQPQDPAVWPELMAKIKIPVFVIGGITEENLPRLIAGGVTRVAVTRAVCGAEHADRATEKLLGLLKGHDARR